MPRLFVAIDVPELLKDDLQAICQGLSGKIRWTPVVQLHLTLCFIGEVDLSHFSAIKAHLSGLSFRPFPLQIQGVGTFAAGRQGQVLWAGVEESSELFRLQGLVESSLVGLGLAPEKRSYRPHLTLARLPAGIPRAALAAYLDRNRQFTLPPFLVGEMLLYSSRLTSSGAIHQREGRYPAH